MLFITGASKQRTTKGIPPFPIQAGVAHAAYSQLVSGKGTHETLRQHDAYSPPSEADGPRPRGPPANFARNSAVYGSDGPLQAVCLPSDKWIGRFFVNGGRAECYLVASQPLGQ